MYLELWGIAEKDEFMALKKGGMYVATSETKFHAHLDNPWSWLLHRKREFIWLLED